MKKMLAALSAATLAGSLAASPAAATIITFDDAISGATTFNFDADNDGLDDVTFSTTDPAGFNTAGPGPNQQFINEPGLEGTTLLNPDLRVDFLVGAEGSLKFGFAINQGDDLAGAIVFSVFDAGNNLLASATGDAVKGTSSFPEGLLTVTFAGTAAYATFDFNNSIAGQRYIIDNFEGAFGTTENPVPEPAIWLQLILGFGVAGAALRSGRRLITATA